MIGKPYAGKLHVRFDEGELEIGLLSTTPVLYSTGLHCHFEQYKIAQLNSRQARLDASFSML